MDESLVNRHVLRDNTSVKNLFEVVFDLVEFRLVGAVTVRQSAVVQKCEYSSIDSVRSRNYGDGSAVLERHGTDCGKDCSENDLKNVGNPSNGAHAMVHVEILGPMPDDISVQSIRDTFGRIIPAGRMKGNVAFSIIDTADSMSNDGPFRGSKKAISNPMLLLLL